MGLTALFSQSAMAQEKANITQLMEVMPSCAVGCMVPLINVSNYMTSPDALCDFEDTECLCSSREFQGTAQACIAEECSVVDALMSRNVTTSTCGYPVRNSSYKLTIVAVTFSVLSAFFVIQRFAVKIFSPDLLLGLDDWMALLAAIIQAPLSGIAVAAGAANGLGKDIWTLTPDQISNFLYYLYVWSTIYFVNIAVCKLAFLLFFLRVFPAPRVRSILWATVGFVGVYGVFFFFMNTFQCSPISFYWQRWQKDHNGKCLNASVIAWVNAIISIVLDLWMICIPLYQLKGINLDWRKKLGVGLMFCVGLVSTIVSTVRLAGLIRHDWNSPNQSYVKLELAIWSIVEINVAIICSCLPAFRSLLVRVFPFMPLGRTHRDNTKETFVEGNRELGFGTISRSVAEKTHNRHLPIVPGAIAMSREYKVEHTIEPSRARGSGSTDTRDIMRLPSLEEFDSCGETLDGRSSFDMKSIERRESDDSRDSNDRKGSPNGEPSAWHRE